MDLTQRPPRSPRTTLGGFVILPRMLDKGRAAIGGKTGEYHYACPLDQYFIGFVDIDPEALQAELAAGKGDGEILAWIHAHGKNPRGAAEIEAWSTFHSRRAPGANDSREFFSKLVTGAGASAREDISTWFDVLDLDDHVSFGGKA